MLPCMTFSKYIYYVPYLKHIAMYSMHGANNAYTYNNTNFAYHQLTYLQRHANAVWKVAQMQHVISQYMLCL